MKRFIKGESRIPRDVCNYIEILYNPKRRHSHAIDVSPVQFENQYFNRLKSV